MDFDIVLGDDIDLLRVDLAFKNDHPMLDGVDDRQNEIQPRIEGFYIFAELLDNIGLRLRDNLDGFEAENHEQQDCCPNDHF